MGGLLGHLPCSMHLGVWRYFRVHTTDAYEPGHGHGHRELSSAQCWWFGHYRPGDQDRTQPCLRMISASCCELRQHCLAGC